MKTSRDFEALETEIARLRDQIDALENEGLEKLELEDTSSARAEEAAAALERLLAEHETERRRIDEQMKEKQDRLERLDAERELVVSELDGELLEEYEVIAKRYPGDAVAKLDGEHCGTCGYEVVPHARQLAAAGDIAKCQNCRRFLYLATDERR